MHLFLLFNALEKQKVLLLAWLLCIPCASKCLREAEVSDGPVGAEHCIKFFTVLVLLNVLG